MIRCPKQLSRKNPQSHKNTFGHILLLAGSRNMTGAAALSSLAAMRSGAGLVTLGIPQSLNSVMHKKISPVIMTLPLRETKEKSLSLGAFRQITQQLPQYDILALGCGLSQNASTQKLICKLIANLSLPMVIDADALNAVSWDRDCLKNKKTVKILTPHPGEMSRLTGLPKKTIEQNRQKTALAFSQKHHVVLVLKGHQTIVASPDGRIHINKTGNAGMATAGSGDVLTGIIAAFLAQKCDAFEAAKTAVHLHGLAGDIAAKTQTKISLIATDIIESIPKAFKKNKLS